MGGRYKGFGGTLAPSAKLHDNTLEDIKGCTFKRVKTLCNFDPYFSDLQMQ